jgi:hypothetical protein
MRRAHRSLVSLGVAWLGLIVGPVWAQAQEASGSAARARALGDSAELDRVVEFYFSGQYDKCTDALSPLLEPGKVNAFTDPAVIERGRLYLATCALLSSHAEQAKSELRRALEANPLMTPPDSLTFPPPVLALFWEVREEVQALISKEEQEQVARLLRENAEAQARALERDRREQRLRTLASEQPVIAQNSRVIAWLPYGAGQYQNGDTTLGHVFLISESLFTVGAVVSASVLLTDYAGSRGVIDESNHSQFQASYTVMTISTIALATSVALGILEANLSFQSERQLGVRKRELPKDLSLRVPQASESRPPAAPASQILPYAAPQADGAVFGVVGRF